MAENENFSGGKSVVEIRRAGTRGTVKASAAQLSAAVLWAEDNQGPNGRG